MKTTFQILPVLFLVLSCTSITDKNSKKFTLKGDITQDSGIIVISYYTDNTRHIDTTKIINGNFTFIGDLLEPTRATLRDNRGLQLASIYIEPSNMRLSIYKDKETTFKLIGSKTQIESDSLLDMLKPHYEKLSFLNATMYKLSDSLKNVKIETVKLNLENKINVLNNLSSKSRDIIDSIEIKYVKENPKSFISVIFLSMLNNNEVITLDTARCIFNRLDISLQKSTYGKQILDIFRKKDNIRVGSLAPDFKAIDLNNHTITLSQFKGSVILLDFWASWCVPCRESIPHLKTLYNRYHSKGLQIIAVSQDESKESWVKAVNQDSTGMWFHIPIAEQYTKGPKYFTDDDIYQNYFVQVIPSTIIINRDGKIIDRFVGNSKENQESLDKILTKIFNN
jgi:peroxiredoxin